MESADNIEYKWLEEINDIDTLDRIASSVDYLDELFTATKEIKDMKQHLLDYKIENYSICKENLLKNENINALKSKLNDLFKTSNLNKTQLYELLNEQYQLIKLRSYTNIKNNLDKNSLSLDEKSENLFNDFINDNNNINNNNNNNDTDLDKFIKEMIDLRTNYHKSCILHQRISS